MTSCVTISWDRLLLLCSWDKSLNIGSHMLRIFLKVPSFTIWQFELYAANQKLLLLYTGHSAKVLYLSCDVLDYLNFCVSVIIKGKQKGLRKRDYLEKWSGPLNKFPRNWFLHDMISWEHHDARHVSNNWLHTVQMVKCKGVNFEENSQMRLPIFKLLSQLHSKYR